MATDKVIERARKLVNLARSPNPQEAAVAAERAATFMAKHGLTEADIAEEETRVLEERCDPLRRELAKAVGILRGLGVLVNTEGTVLFRGKPRDIGGAAEFYRTLVAMADDCWRDVRVRGSPDPVVSAWRKCAWLGFVDAVIERVIEEKKRAPASPMPPPSRTRRRNARPAPVAAAKGVPVAETPAEAASAVEDWTELPPAEPEPVRPRRADAAASASPMPAIAGALNQIRYNVNVEWLYREAVALGRATGMSANISELRGADDDRSLPQRSEVS